MEDVTKGFLKFLPNQLKMNDAFIDVNKTRTSDLSLDNILDIKPNAVNMNLQILNDTIDFNSMNEGGYTEGLDRHYWTFRAIKYRIRLYSDVVVLKNKIFEGIIDSDYINFDSDGIIINSLVVGNKELIEDVDWVWNDPYHQEIKLIGNTYLYLGKPLHINYNFNMGGEEVINRASLAIIKHIKSYLEQNTTKKKYPVLDEYHVGWKLISDIRVVPQQLLTETLHGLEFDVTLTYYDHRTAEGVVSNEAQTMVEHVVTNIEIDFGEDDL